MVILATPLLCFWVVISLCCNWGWSFYPPRLSHPFKDVIHYFEKNVPLNVVIIYEVHEIVGVLKMLNHFLWLWANRVEIAPVCLPQSKCFILGEEEGEEGGWEKTWGYERKREKKRRNMEKKTRGRRWPGKEKWWQIKKNGKKLKEEERGEGDEGKKEKGKKCFKIMTLSETEFGTILGTNTIPSIFGSWQGQQQWAE